MGSWVSNKRIYGYLIFTRKIYMASLKASIVALYRLNNKLTVSDLEQTYPDANPKTIANCLSMARKYAGPGDEPPKIFTKVTEEEIEKVIVDKLNGIKCSVNNADINLAINFLKIKRSGSGLEDELDIEKYIKRVVADAKP